MKAELIELQREVKQLLNKFQNEHKITIEQLQLVTLEKPTLNLDGVTRDIIKVEILVKA